mgnify:FL=1
MYKAFADEKWEKAVTNLTQLMEDCNQSVKHICLKMECLLKCYMFEEANTYSASIMKREKLANNPRILCWRGKALIYMGGDILGKKHL